MAYPKIVYNETIELAFTYPPVMKAGADEIVADRADDVTLSGLKQSMWERNDIFKTLQMDFVPMEDMSAWAAFLDFALTGAPFDYFSDADVTDTFTSYTVEDTNWTPAYNMHGIAKFKLRLRQLVC